MTYPCEDYMERHNIQISYIKSINSGCVFFKYKGFFDQIAEWHLLTINWKEPTWHPGAYYIRTYKPVHDGYKNKLFAQLSEDKVYLDDYEDYFISWIKTTAKSAKGQEVELVAWEIYLYCYDSLLVNYISQPGLVATIDTDLAVSERLDAIRRVVFEFKKKCPVFVEAWQMVVSQYLEGYSHWLADLIDRR